MAEPEDEENLQPVPLRMSPPDIVRIENWKKLYRGRVGKGMPPRLLMLMGLREADNLGELDLTLLSPGRQSSRRLGEAPEEDEKELRSNDRRTAAAPTSGGQKNRKPGKAGSR